MPCALPRASEGMIFYWYSPIPHCHYNTIARGLGNKSCAAMDGLLSVSPPGRRPALLVLSRAHGEPPADALPRRLVLPRGASFQEQGVRARGVRGVRQLHGLPGRLPAVLAVRGDIGDQKPPSGGGARRALNEGAEGMEMKYVIPKIAFPARLVVFAGCAAAGPGAAGAHPGRLRLPPRHRCDGPRAHRFLGAQLPQQADGHRPGGLAAGLGAASSTGSRATSS